MGRIVLKVQKVQLIPAIEQEPGIQAVDGTGSTFMLAGIFFS